LIRQNPAALQPILAQLAQSAPPIYNVIIFSFSSLLNTHKNSNKLSLMSKAEKVELVGNNNNNKEILLAP
jgi:hypothetical protein